MLKEAQPPVPLAKVDATVHKSLDKKYKIKGFPTLQFFNKGKKKEYNGNRTAKGIYNWVTKRTRESSAVQSTLEDLEGVKNNKVSVVYFGKDDHFFLEFIEVSKDYLDIKSVNFYHVIPFDQLYCINLKIR